MNVPGEARKGLKNSPVRRFLPHVRPFRASFGRHSERTRRNPDDDPMMTRSRSGYHRGMIRFTSKDAGPNRRRRCFVKPGFQRGTCLSSRLSKCVTAWIAGATRRPEPFDDGQKLTGACPRTLELEDFVAHFVVTLNRNPVIFDEVCDEVHWCWGFGTSSAKPVSPSYPSSSACISCRSRTGKGHCAPLWSVGWA